MLRLVLLLLYLFAPPSTSPQGKQGAVGLNQLPVAATAEYGAGFDPDGVSSPPTEIGAGYDPDGALSPPAAPASDAGSGYDPNG